MNSYHSSIQEATALELDHHAHYEQQIAFQINEDLNWFHEGEVDGSLGLKPRFPENPIYWQGYQKELKNYWVKH